MIKDLTLFTSLLLILLAPDGLRAETFQNACPDLAACAKVVGELLGQKYVYDSDLKGSAKITPNVDLTKENAEILF